MTRIEQKFRELSLLGRKGLITYMTAGDPNLKATFNLVKSFEKEGVDFIELGIPFSDPLADGVVNQLAATRALETGTNIRKILILVKEVRKKSEIPIILFTYFNPVLKYGLKKFASHAHESGVDGFLVLDLPPEEADECKALAKENHMDMIFLVSPTSTAERIRLTTSSATGFIYCVSRTGVTGASQEISKEVPDLIQRIRRVTSLPIAIGFGISNAEQVSVLSRMGDAVVVGSAIVKKIEENRKNSDLGSKVSKFIRPFVRAAHVIPVGMTLFE